MFKTILARARQGYRTVRFPDTKPALPDRFRGRPELGLAKCPPGCRDCVEACPTEAIRTGAGGIRVDLGRCLFCPECEGACAAGMLRMGQDFRLASRERESLKVVPGEGSAMRPLQGAARRLFGRSLKLRQVSVGGCNGCEADVNVLNTVVYDLGRFGVQFVASPRHADGLLITGPVTRNMAGALRETYEAVPPPKLVIAVGACAISGGPFRGFAPQQDGVGEFVPVDLYIPGCPPHPLTILDGLLSLLGQNNMSLAIASDKSSV